MNGRSVFDTERTVVLRRDVVTIRLLTKLYAFHADTPCFKPTQRGNGVFRRVIKQAYRYQHRQIARQPAVLHKIEAGLFHIRVSILRTMPWIGGRDANEGLMFVWRMAHLIVQFAMLIQPTDLHLAHGVP